MSATNRLLAALAAAVYAPVMLIIAVAIRLDSGGPVIYTESRLGYRGRRFRIYKFRTLRADHGDPRLVAPVGDERVTRVGDLIRRYHLDELPQLINILRGDMNFIGPRPTRPELWGGVEPLLRERALAFKPGLASLASLRYLCEDEVLGACEDPETLYRDIIFPAKVAEDVRYFENRTPLDDLRIFQATFSALMRRRHEPECYRRLAELLAQEPADGDARRCGGTDGHDRESWPHDEEERRRAE